MDWMAGNSAAQPSSPGGWAGACAMQRIEWVKSLLELILLLLAIPWILIRLFREPGKGMRDLGEGYFG